METKTTTMLKTASKLAATLTLAILSILTLQPSTALAQATAFTYQGRLDSGGNPANGLFDFRFTLHGDAVLPGFEVGLPRTNTAVAVSNGLFTTTVDFGPAFDHQPHWLELGVRPAGSTNDFITLTPRQPVTVAPRADHANRAQTLTSPINEGLLPSSALRRYVNENVTGLFHFTPLPGNPPFTVGSSVLVTNLNADKLDGLEAADFWKIGGNAGTTPGTHFLGTTDPQPFELKVNNLRALRIEENGDGSDPGTTPDGAPNLIGGAPVNSVAAGVVGATISGGGATNFSGGTWPNLIDSDYSTVGGGVANTVAANSRFAAIGGGGFNSIGANAAASIVGGGAGNDIGEGSLYATVTGGYENDISSNAPTAVIGGGDYNKIGEQATAATIAGGRSNRVENGAPYASLGGGDENRVAGPYGTIPGGRFNYAVSYGFAAGRQAKSFHPGAFVWADSQAADFASTTSNQFNVRASGGARFVTGGAGLTVDGQPVLTGQNGGTLTNLNASQLTIGTVPAAALDNAWKIGGNAGTEPATHFLGTADNQAVELRVNNQRALRLEPNTISPNVIAGFSGNFVGPGNFGSTIGGGGSLNNSNAIFTRYATIAGGAGNDIGANSDYSAIGGGDYNHIASNSWSATIAGGAANDIGTDSFQSAIGGGFDNNIAANSPFATIAGGYWNDIGTGSPFSAIGGGWNNNITNNAAYATIPGGFDNTATNYAFAAGRRARAIHTGAFVWSDSTDADFASTANNQFALRATGGVRIESNPGLSLNAADTPLITRGWDPFGGTAPAAKQGHGRWGLFMEPSRLVIGIPSNDIPNRFFSVAKYHPNGTFTSLLTVDQSGWVTATGFTSTSDRAAKHNFQPLAPDEVLAKVVSLPVNRWQFKDDPSEAWHVGPTAQDFHAAFGLGADDKHIATVDADGVALLAIQGLNQKLTEELKRRDAENAELKTELAELKKLVQALTTTLNGSTP